MALCVLAVNTGMRLGEIVALKWRDVDLATGILQVKAGRTRTLAGFADDDP
jgi:integrase